jgi:tRNA pseudouridine38-40 synthase
MNYKLTISYDGTRYKGWQRLGDTDMTVQNKIENVLFEMFFEPVELHGSGRTDAGVHAVGQVAHFKIDKDVQPKEIKEYLYRYLPDDIVVTGVKKMDDRFHARLNATKKTYVYKIYNDFYHNPFLRKQTLHVQEHLELDAMKKAAAYFIGEYDFSAYTTAKSKKKSNVRTIESVDIFKSGHEIDIHITGNGFLHNMARKIVGTILEVGLGNFKATSVPGIINDKDRSKTGTMAPPRGLYLYKVHY